MVMTSCGGGYGNRRAAQGQGSRVTTIWRPLFTHALVIARERAKIAVVGTEGAAPGNRLVERVVNPLRPSAREQPHAGCRAKEHHGVRVLHRWNDFLRELEERQDGGPGFLRAAVER